MMSPLDKHEGRVKELLSQGLNRKQIVVQLKSEGIRTSDRSLRRAIKRWGMEAAMSTPGESTGSVHFSSEDEAEVTSPPLAVEDISDPEQVIRARGIDPEDWLIAGMTVNEWDSPTGLMRQLKVQLRKKKALAFPEPARTDGYRPKQAKRKAPKGEPEMVVFVGDQQAPFHDPHLHELFLDFLDDVKPHRGVLIGDTVDLPDISRHRLNPENTAKVQECVNAGYELCRDYVQASEETDWVKLCGNHDERIRAALIDWATQLYGLKRAEVPGQDEPSVLSIPYLLRLDELGIEYIDPEGSYMQAQYKVSEHLAARHGHIARKGSGASALATLNQLGHSVVHGHTHRQSLVTRSTHDIDGEVSTLAAAEIGCMCRIEGGLGYAVSPDWTNGFATAHIWPDGKFKLELGTYVNGVLLWSDRRYE